MLDRIYKIGLKINDSNWLMLMLLIMLIINFAVYTNVSFPEDATKFIMNINYHKPVNSLKSVLQISSDWIYNIVMVVLIYSSICAVVRYFKKQETV